MFDSISRNELIKIFAEEIATEQKKADRWFYIKQDRQMSSFILDQICGIKKITNNLGITKEVYNEAYKIYDFRDSGKPDYKPDLKQLIELQFLY